MEAHPKASSSAPYEGPVRVVGCTFVMGTLSTPSEVSISADDHPLHDRVTVSDCTFVSNSVEIALPVGDV